MLEALVGQGNPLTGFDEMIQARARDTFDKTPQSKTPKVEAGPRGTKATIDGPNSDPGSTSSVNQCRFDMPRRSDTKNR